MSPSTVAPQPCGMCVESVRRLLPHHRDLSHAQKLRKMRLLSWLRPHRLAKSPLLIRSIVYALAHGQGALAKRRINIWLGLSKLNAADRARLRVDLRVLGGWLRASTHAERSHHLHPHPLIDWTDMPVDFAPLLVSHRMRMLGPMIFDAILAGPPHEPGYVLVHFDADGSSEVIARESVDCASTPLDFATRARRRAFEPATGGPASWTSA